MSASRVVTKTVDSTRLIFGLEWFAILGGAVSREVKRLARQQKATHVVYARDDAVSVGMANLPSNKRHIAQYSAAQLVALHYSTGAVALILELDTHRWWFVAVHQGGVIARTDDICSTRSEAYERVMQLRQAYPDLTLLNDEKHVPVLSDFVSTLPADAQLQRIAYKNRLLTRPFYGLVLGALVAYGLYHVGIFGGTPSRNAPAALATQHEQLWLDALHAMTESHWVHGVAGTAHVLASLYDLPIRLGGWLLHGAECNAREDRWHCHADYGRDDYAASNDRFLDAAPSFWKVNFTPLELARVTWSFAASGRSLTRTSKLSSQYVERSLFSGLQSIRPAFARINVEPARDLSGHDPRDEFGQALSRPVDLPRYRVRDIQVQAPLRSISLLLPYAQAMAWDKVVLTVDPRASPDLIHSRLNIHLHGVLYEQN